MRVEIVVLLALWGCSDEKNLVPLDLDLNRMVEQPRYEPYGWSGFFDDGRAMRHPPEGTVAWGEVSGPPGLVEGPEDGAWVQAIPLPVTRELLERGRRGFDVVCATCHGVLGTGESPVARNMELVKPPSLHMERIREMPPGRLHAVIARGYGLMPGYRFMLDATERWAIVAYVQALQLSQRARLAELPPRIREKALRELPP